VLDVPLKDLSPTGFQYHPDANPGDDEASVIFQKVGIAYATICDPIVDNGESLEILRPWTQEEAQKAYQEHFGNYRELYYSEAALIGLPFSLELRESLQKSQKWRNSFSHSLGLSRVRISFFQAWFIKKEMNWVLLVAETLLFWWVCISCKWHLDESACPVHKQYSHYTILLSQAHSSSSSTVAI